jgi:hypothetical protein
MSLGLGEQIVNQDERGRIALLSFQRKLCWGHAFHGIPRNGIKEILFQSYKSERLEANRREEHGRFDRSNNLIV